MGTSGQAGSRVFWTDAEKRLIVERAADLRKERPDLSGLPLVRAAMRVLPAGRRRKLIAQSQVSWFEGALADEIRMREIEARAQGDLYDLLRGHDEFHRQWHLANKKWQATQTAMLAGILDVLKEIRAAVRLGSRSNKR